MRHHVRSGDEGAPHAKDSVLWLHKTSLALYGRVESARAQPKLQTSLRPGLRCSMSGAQEQPAPTAAASDAPKRVSFQSILDLLRSRKDEEKFVGTSVR